MFLRGHGVATSSHYGTVTHQSDALGILQGDATRDITGNVNLGGSISSLVAIEGTSQGALAGSRWRTGQFAEGPYTKSGYAGISFDASRVVPTAVENRPVNRAVVYLVRAR